jgi:hypothetical protein
VYYDFIFLAGHEVLGQVAAGHEVLGQVLAGVEQLGQVAAGHELAEDLGRS